MSSPSNDFQVSTSDAFKKWPRYTGRLLSVTCVGYCLQTSYNENPKSAALAFAGGASAVILAKCLRDRLTAPTRCTTLQRAGGFFSLTGVTWCLTTAFDEHPQATLKATLAGALSIYLTESITFNFQNSWTIKKGPMRKAMRKMPSASVMLYTSSNVAAMQMDFTKYVGEELKKLCRDFDLKFN